MRLPSLQELSFISKFQILGICFKQGHWKRETWDFKDSCHFKQGAKIYFCLNRQNILFFCKCNCLSEFEFFFPSDWTMSGLGLRGLWGPLLVSCGPSVPLSSTLLLGSPVSRLHHGLAFTLLCFHSTQWFPQLHNRPSANELLPTECKAHFKPGMITFSGLKISVCFFIFPKNTAFGHKRPPPTWELFMLNSSLHEWKWRIQIFIL